MSCSGDQDTCGLLFRIKIGAIVELDVWSSGTEEKYYSVNLQVVKLGGGARPGLIFADRLGQ